MRMCIRGRHRMVTETSKTTNFRACFFLTHFSYWLANLLIDIIFALASYFQTDERNQRNNQL